MKYNSVENAEVFIPREIEWCLTNGYYNFTIWSNGKELTAMTDEKDIVSAMERGRLKNEGYWKAIIYRNGYRVEI